MTQKLLASVGTSGRPPRPLCDSLSRSPKECATVCAGTGHGPGPKLVTCHTSQLY